MPHLGIGILDSQSNGPAPAGFTHETDWTTGSLPSPWVETGVGQTYTGTGTYGGSPGDGANYGTWEIDITDVTYTQLTMMVGILVNTWSETYFDAAITGVPGADWAVEYFPAGVTDQIDISIGSEFAATITTGDMGTGILVFGGTMDTGGNWTWYHLKSGLDTVTTSTNSPASITAETLTVYLDAYDFINDVPGTPGDVRLIHTYFDSTTVLDQTAIEAKAVSWGWTP